MEFPMCTKRQIAIMATPLEKPNPDCSSVDSVPRDGHYASSDFIVSGRNKAVNAAHAKASALAMNAQASP